MIIEIISCPTRRGNQAKSARLATLIKNGLGITPSIIHDKSGQFEVRVDGQKVVERRGIWLTRLFGAGYPDLDRVVELLKNRSSTQKKTAGR